MSSSPRPVRLPVFVAAATVSALALAACSSGSDTAATSTAPAASTTSSTTSSAMPTSTSTAPATTATTTTSTPPTSTTSKATSTTPKSTARTSTTPPPSTKFINACVTANSKLNTAVSQWNAAVASGNDAKLDAAAKNFTTTATALMGLRTVAWDRQFSLDVQAIASELNAMANARKNNQTVTTTDFNAKVTTLRTYCQSRLKS